MNTAPQANGHATAPASNQSPLNPAQPNPALNPFTNVPFAPDQSPRFREIMQLAHGGYARREAFAPHKDLRHAAEMARAGAALIAKAMRVAVEYGIEGAGQRYDDDAALVAQVAAETADGIDNGLAAVVRHAREG